MYVLIRVLYHDAPTTFNMVPILGPFFFLNTIRWNSTNFFFFFAYFFWTDLTTASSSSFLEIFPFFFSLAKPYLRNRLSPRRAQLSLAIVEVGDDQAKSGKQVQQDGALLKVASYGCGDSGNGLSLGQFVPTTTRRRSDYSHWKAAVVRLDTVMPVVLLGCGWGVERSSQCVEAATAANS